MTGPFQILLATGNAGKLRELQALTADTAIRWCSLADFEAIPAPAETGATFIENARLKALYYSAATGISTLADDSGLEVDALGGAPGVCSARYAGEPRDDRRNNAKLIAALHDVPTHLRTARFCCAMSFAAEGEVKAEAEGAIDGLIVDNPRGDNGFGYDPHFFLPQFSRTMAELSPAMKNAISHRGQALRMILSPVEEYARRDHRS